LFLLKDSLSGCKYTAFFLNGQKKAADSQRTRGLATDFSKFSLLINVQSTIIKRGVEEHQIGEYVYDLQVPDLKAPPTKSGGSWLNNIFKERMRKNGT